MQAREEGSQQTPTLPAACSPLRLQGGAERDIASKAVDGILRKVGRGSKEMHQALLLRAPVCPG